MTKWYGNVINRIMEDYGKADIQIGDGATLLMWSDRHAYTIIEVERYVTGARIGEIKAVVAQQDKATRLDGLGMSDSQSYTYQPNPNAEKERFTLRKDGRFRKVGSVNSSVLAIGERREYYDYSF
jgi:hypothetical protein